MKIRQGQYYRAEVVMEPDDELLVIEPAPEVRSILVSKAVLEAWDSGDWRMWVYGSKGEGSGPNGRPVFRYQSDHLDEHPLPEGIVPLFDKLMAGMTQA